MADRKFDRAGDPRAERDRIIRQRNLALALVLVFFVALFFAITMVKMRHIRLPQKPASAASAPGPGSSRGQ